VTSDCHCSKY